MEQQQHVGTNQIVQNALQDIAQHIKKKQTAVKLVVGYLKLTANQVMQHVVNVLQKLALHTTQTLLLHTRLPQLVH
jgi:Zn finger protein HypA/HybF involved in hydrogenase expression